MSNAKMIGSTGSQDKLCSGHRDGKRERCPKGRSREGEFRLGGHMRDMENAVDPRRPNRGTSDPARGNGSHHALLRPTMTSPRRGSGRGLNTQKDKARAGRRGDTWNGVRPARKAE